MVSEYVREQKRYTRVEIRRILGTSEEQATRLIRRMKEYGILKTVRSSELQWELTELRDEDIEVADVEETGNDYLYIFTFVGVIVISGRVLKCYPKYLLHSEKPLEELHQILKVLDKYNSKEQPLCVLNAVDENRSSGRIAVLLYFLHDYYENGLYNNSKDIIEMNGAGEILWEKTIHSSYALLSNNRPYYMELFTRKSYKDDYDYFTRLHKCILTKVSKELFEADLLMLFEITGVELSEEELDDFGDRNQILYRIENELNTQFNTRKQLVLKAMHSYVEQKKGLRDSDSFSVYGTNSFNLVWERVCADILNNQLEENLESLRLPIPLKSGYDRKCRLIDLIERPYWSLPGMAVSDTLIPDMVTITKIGREYQFIIFDAKYYVAQLEEGVQPKGQPGIEAIAKQYLYQAAFQTFIKDHMFSMVKNCFLLPTESEEIIDKGVVRLEMLSGLGLQDIEIRMIPAGMAYEYYLSGKQIDIELLNL